MTILISIFLLVLCCCNIGIWWKFQQRNSASRNAIHQQNRARQVRRLTKTLLIVSAAAVFSWLPHAIILNMTAANMVSVPIIILHCFYILTYSTSFVNPIIYALKIPEFRQSLITLCSRRRAVDRMDREGKDGQDTVTIDLIEPRTLPTDPSYTELNFEHKSMDTKLWSPKTAKKAFLSPPTARCNKPWIN